MISAVGYSDWCSEFFAQELVSLYKEKEDVRETSDVSKQTFLNEE